MSEYASKKALLEFIKARKAKFAGSYKEIEHGAYLELDTIEAYLESGIFEADESEGTWKATAEILGRENAQMNSEVQRLRAALEKARQYVVNGYELGYIDDREGYTEALVREIDKALSTTTEPTGPSISSTRLEPTGAERVKEFCDLLRKSGKAYGADWIEHAFKLAGIIIPGINAPEKEDKTCVMCRRREGVNLSTANRWYCQPCTDALPSVDKEETDA